MLALGGKRFFPPSFLSNVEDEDILMRKTTLFIAASLDGYIARKDGGVDWLHGQDASADDMTGYDAFIRDIDTVVMGWNTYHQVTAELSRAEWPYRGLTAYVMTHRTPPPTKEDIQFVDRDVCALIAELKQRPGKGIWICGGAGVIRPLLQGGEIDRLHISVIPILLGDGIPLFGGPGRELPLQLLRTESYNGITDLVYDVE